jgi:molecular chaperone GrpE
MFWFDADLRCQSWEQPLKKSHDKADKTAARNAAASAEDETALVNEELERVEAADAARAQAEQAGGAAIAEPSDSAVQRTEQQAAEWKDRALRATADFDNYRKRAIKERDEAYGRGSAEAFGKIVEVIDDLARVAHLDPAQTTSAALHDGMLAIERKFLRVLELAGLERIDPVGQPFDPNSQEAVSAMPAQSAEQDHTVGAVYQHGYRYKGQLLRPARVAVLQWSGAPAGDGADA